MLDWDRLRVGPLAAEVVRTASLIFGSDCTPELRALDLERVAAFTVGYRELIPLSEASLAQAVDRFWWERMYDFWQLRWHYEKTDTSCDHLFVSASAKPISVSIGVVTTRWEASAHNSVRSRSVSRAAV